MCYVPPAELAASLLRELTTRESAIAYAEKIAAMEGPLSPDYAIAAKILRKEEPAP